MKTPLIVLPDGYQWIPTRHTCGGYFFNSAMQMRSAKWQSAWIAGTPLLATFLTDQLLVNMPANRLLASCHAPASWLAAHGKACFYTDPCTGDDSIVNDSIDRRKRIFDSIAGAMGWINGLPDSWMDWCQGQMIGFSPDGLEFCPARIDPRKPWFEMRRAMGRLLTCGDHPHWYPTCFNGDYFCPVRGGANTPPSREKCGKICPWSLAPHPQSTDSDMAPCRSDSDCSGLTYGRTEALRRVSAAFWAKIVSDSI